MEEGCKNCKKESAIKWVRGYCEKCYPIILKIDKLQKGKEQSYNKNYRNNEGNHLMRLEHVRQLKIRLKDIWDSENFLEHVDAHELERKINSTLRHISIGGNLKRYGMGKINDYLGSGLHYKEGDNKRNIFIYNLFSKIKVKSRWSFDWWKIYDAPFEEENELIKIKEIHKLRKKAKKLLEEAKRKVEEEIEK